MTPIAGDTQPGEIPVSDDLLANVLETCRDSARPDKRAYYAIALELKRSRTPAAKPTVDSDIAARDETIAKLRELIERWLMLCTLSGVDAERDGEIPDNPSLNPYIQLMIDSRAAITPPPALAESGEAK